MPSAQSIRDENLTYLNKHGFKPATWMPLPVEAGQPSEEGFAGGILRPAEEIAQRYCCHFAVFAWGSAPPDFESAIDGFMEKNQLRLSMTDDEQQIVGQPKDAAMDQYAGMVGWRLENMWSLAWILGLAPDPSAITGQLTEEISGGMLDQFLPDLAVTIDSLLASGSLQSVDEVIRMEDLLYLSHNAVRAGQTGNLEQLPEGFDPIGDGGAIHERRHSLTWALSPGVPWDETDLST